MSETKKYIKKSVLADGTIKEYEYEFDKNQFNKYMKEYQTRAGLNSQTECEICGKSVQKRFLKKHQAKPICLKYSNNPDVKPLIKNHIPTGIYKNK